MVISERKDYRDMCRLDDGSIVPYDGAALNEASDFYTPDKWEFIGTGVIHNTGGVLRCGNENLWFYVWKR